MLINLFIEFLVLTFLLWNVRADEYTNHLQKYCKKTRKPFFCVKYRILKIIDDFEYESPDSETVRLVKIEPKVDDTYDLAAPRYLETDTELEKVIKFFQRKLVRFANTHGFQFRLPEGVEIISSRGVNNSNIVRQEISTDSSRKKPHFGHLKPQDKKLLEYVIPVILLIQLYLVKMGFHTLLFGLVVLKTLLVKAAFWLPYLAYQVKSSCLREGLLKEIWNGFWKRQMNLDSNQQYSKNL
ncbi:hypothetical protein GWI33_013246 [Rhynchophorus ferrugineus]|uniref:Uncharacterized protein n=1 Tax=Rhynchophorus ferrugineus TaxID=354439 RepID=A0A834I6V3_RHYFE|nr:hypothetical protein GWI33_013246 [Rhynchophorus ferrugineus]